MEKEFMVPDLTKWRKQEKEDFDCEADSQLIFELADVLAEGCLQDDFQAYQVQSSANDEIGAIVSSLHAVKEIRTCTLTAVDRVCPMCSGYNMNSPVTLTLWLDETGGEVICIHSSMKGWVSLLADEKGKKFLQTI